MDRSIIGGNFVYSLPFSGHEEQSSVWLRNLLLDHHGLVCFHDRGCMLGHVVMLWDFLQYFGFVQHSTIVMGCL